ncbi:hypothetical protein FRC02_001808 [Tulasnella sp. 418]|nr:hypothetical protein FRC02_001808 [Tulasnella sp. 418]
MHTLLTLLGLRSPNQAGFLSFDLSADGSLLATGTELKGDGAPILFWDIRKPKEPLYIHAMTHSDDVTVLEFSSAANSNQELLLSGSSDGLLSISSPREQDEEEAVSQVGNWRCSVSKCGWAGQDSAGQPLVWSVSDMESFATWNHQMELLDNYVDLRLAKLEGTWETKNVIDATWTADPAPLVSSASDLLGVWVGTSDGNIGLMTSSSRQSWSLHRIFRGGHTSIVRSILWAPGPNCLISGGEDSKINIWPLGQASGQTPARKPRNVDEDGDVEMGAGSPPSSKSRSKRVIDESKVETKPGKKSRIGHM